MWDRAAEAVENPPVATEKRFTQGTDRFPYGGAFALVCRVARSPITRRPSIAVRRRRYTTRQAAGPPVWRVAQEVRRKKKAGEPEGCPGKERKDQLSKLLAGRHQRAQTAGPFGGAQLAQRLGLDLADSLAGDIEFLPDLF